MTGSSLEQIFQTRLQQAIAELNSDGWAVVESPPAESLPDWLHDLQLDLVATKGQEILIGEVKSRQSAGLEDLNELADLVSKVANARLEIYWLGDAPESELPTGNIRLFITEATELVSTGRLTSGTLTAWAALEGAIIHFAEGKNDLQAWRSPWQLLSNLYSLGHISENDFKRLSSIARLRNEIAHHVSRTVPRAEDIGFVLEIAERMISGQYISVDQMVEWFLEHYEDPAMWTPHDSAEGGYQYHGNEPYDARDVLADEFPGTPEDDISQAVDLLEDTATEWVAKNRSPEREQ